MDTKYGRIYTDADIRKLGEKLLGDRAMGPDILAEALADLEPELTIPADEPTFLMRGQDELARDRIEDYLYAQRLVPSTYESVRSTLEAFDRFSGEHADRMKVPD